MGELPFPGEDVLEFARTRVPKETSAVKSEELVEIQLGRVGLDYARERLECEGKTIAKCVLSEMDLGLGRVHTLLPKYVRPEEARNLTDGVLQRDPPAFRHVEGKDGQNWRVEPVPTLNHHLTAKIAASLTSQLWIFGEPTWTSSAPWFQKFTGCSWMLLGQEIYWVVENDANLERVEATVRRAASAYPGLLGFSITQNELSVLGTVGGQMKASAPDIVAGSLTEIAIGAYDGEAFIYWTPS